MKLKQRLKGIRITEQLAEQIRAAAPKVKALLLDALEHYVGQFKQAEREQRPMPGARALCTHNAMTIWIEQITANPPNGHTVQCRRGCSSCCRLMITVFPDEAVLAAVAAREAGVAIDRDRLRCQAAARTVDEWRQLSREDRTCVFLRDNECTIYEYRPGACRKYAVASPRELCDTDKYPGHEVAMVVSAMAEVVASAAVTTWSESPFAPALLRALDAPIDHLTLKDPAP